MTGDVQLVATIACVIGSCPFARPLLGTEAGVHLERFLLAYAELLYSWGLHDTRLEVLKHVPAYADFVVRARNDACPWQFQLEQSHGGGDGGAEPSKQKSNKSRALSCGFCQLPVYGLHVACMKCLHGGHSSHMGTWFEKHSTCPTGCGCVCTMAVQS
jgi:hypothetical protein